jgi:hypothetical protein
MAGSIGPFGGLYDAYILYPEETFPSEWIDDLPGWGSAVSPLRWRCARPWKTLLDAERSRAAQVQVEDWRMKGKLPFPEFEKEEQLKFKNTLDLTLLRT